MSAKEINPEIQLLAQRIKDGMTFGENGVATVAADFYEKALPEGVTKEQYIALQDFNTNIAAAGTLALGEASIPQMQKDLSVVQTSMTIPTFGKDHFAFTFTKERAVPTKSADGVTGTKASWGTASVAFEQYGLGKRGEMAKVKNFLSVQAAEAFASADTKAA